MLEVIFVFFCSALSSVALLCCSCGGFAKTSCLNVNDAITEEQRQFCFGSTQLRKHPSFIPFLVLISFSFVFFFILIFV